MTDSSLSIVSRVPTYLPLPVVVVGSTSPSRSWPRLGTRTKHKGHRVRPVRWNRAECFALAPFPRASPLFPAWQSVLKSDKKQQQMAPEARFPGGRAIGFGPRGGIMAIGNTRYRARCGMLSKDEALRGTALDTALLHSAHMASCIGQISLIV